MPQKYLCPVCGAAHKSKVDKCRLCGQQMGADAVVGERQETRYVEERRAGLGGPLLIVIVIVVAIVAVFVFAGVIPGLRSVEKAAENVPFLPQDRNDGWTELVYPEGGFSAQLPGGERQLQKEGNTYTATMVIGKETEIKISATPLMSATEYSDLTQTSEADPSVEVKRHLKGLADNFEAGLAIDKAKVDKRTDTYAAGVPAVYYDLRAVKNTNPALRTGETFYARTILFVYQGILYNITVTSIYQNPEQFDRVLGSFGITGRPGEPTTTTAPAP
jgi:hypothetical protein